MLGVTDLWTYVVGTVAIILLPGPNALYVLTTAAKRGVADGYRAASGVFVGDAVLMVLSAAGVASLLKAYPPVFTLVKYLGAAYLVWLGIGMIRGAWRRPSLPAASEARPAENPFRKALVVSLLNPKAILFFVSFFIQFVDPAYPYPAVSFLLLGAIASLTSALYLSLLIFTGTFLATQFRRRRRLSAGMTSVVGAVFLGFGLRLASG
ncbi:leucine efflux protein LeuE [Virgisporangium ochraceum]|uniref:Leucine efflux protein n=1 Tax=Virgisporangium ochraceum TaxID=65505 RepID=A0A8J3ZPK3_9ACTN|nr:leucine efflux protein [Virgisporangium ochraceum]